MTRSLARDDEGMTLVELIVVILVTALFLTIVGVIFGSGLAAQQRATERDAATGTLNAAMAAVTETVRSSTAIHVSASGQRLDARMLNADGTTWECRSWQVLEGTLLYSAGGTKRGVASTSWTPLATGITGALAGDAAFSQSAGHLTLGWELAQGDTEVTITGGANALLVHSGGPTCWD